MLCVCGLFVYMHAFLCAYIRVVEIDNKTHAPCRALSSIFRSTRWGFSFRNGQGYQQRPDAVQCFSIVLIDFIE